MKSAVFSERIRLAGPHYRHLIMSCLLILSVVSNAQANSDLCQHVFNSYKNSASEKSATTVRTLQKLANAAGKSDRPNPKAIEVSSIQEGEDYYVAPFAFAAYAHLKKSLNEPVKMKALKVSSSFERAIWKQGKTIIYLESPETGRIAIEGERLKGNVYSVPDFGKFAPFTAGEFVEIKSSIAIKQVFRLAQHPERTIELSDVMDGYMGRFVRSFDETHYVIQFEDMDRDIMPTQILVPRNLVRGLTSGTAAHFKNAVKELLEVPIEFKTDELVRYRNTNGNISLGHFLQENGTAMTIVDLSGHHVSVPAHQVFRYIEGDPVTPQYAQKWVREYFEQPNDLILNFLDAAGKLSSLSDFSSLSAKEKLATMLKFLIANIPWSSSALRAESAGLQNLNDMLCAGAGVCRHVSLLLNSIFSELGYSSRVTNFLNAEGDGHAWLEVDVKMPDGQMKTFVVDPSNGSYVKSYAEVVALAAKNKNSNAAKWYSQPTRTYFSVNRQ